MRVKVLKKFKDIKTGKIHKVGDVINVTKERYEEILKNGREKGASTLVEEYKEKSKEDKKEN